MSGPSLHQITVRGGKVVLTTRYWDGIDRPDYTTIEPLVPHQAEQWAKMLIEHAAIAREQSSAAQKEQLQKLRSQRIALDEQIKSLEKTIGD